MTLATICMPTCTLPNARAGAVASNRASLSRPLSQSPLTISQITRLYRRASEESDQLGSCRSVATAFET